MRRTKYLTTSVILCLLLVFTATAQAQTEEDNASFISQSGAKIGAIPEDAVVVSMPRDATLPVSFDWRDVDGVDWMTSVKSQIGGTCWAFSATAVVEAVINIQMNDPTLDVDLSEWQLVSACCEAGGSSGGYPEKALEYMRGGILTEEEFPYVGGVSCSCDLPDGWEENGSWSIVNYIYIDNTTEDFKRALVKYGPMAVVLNPGDMSVLDTTDIASTSIDTAKFREIPTACHAVALVGYNDMGNYWIIKDSGNFESFGFGGPGYKTIPYGEIERHNYAFVITGVSKNTGVWEKPTVATASSYSDEDHSPGKAIDKNQRTSWRSEKNDKEDSWIQFDLEEEKPVKMIRMMVFPTVVPLTVDVQVSNDAMNWKTVASDGIVKRGNTFYTIPFDQTTARYIKVIEKSFDGSFGTCVEFNIYIPDEIGEWTDPVWAWSPTWWGNGFDPRIAIDNDLNTHWFSGSYQSSFPKWIFFAMDEIIAMDKVRIMIFSSDLPMEIDIQVSDGTLPTDTYPYLPWEWEIVLSNFTVTEGNTFVEIPFSETVNARYVKVWQTSHNKLGRNFGTCTEFDVHVI